MKKLIQHYLGEVVYGGIDGIVTTFAIIAASAGADLSSKVILVLGFASLLADGFSMGVSAYLSAKTKQEQERDSSHSPRGVGISTFIAFIAVGILPILVYVIDFAAGTDIEKFNLFIGSIVIAIIAFGLIGFARRFETQESRLKTTLETVLLGSGAALIAYLLGDVLERIVLK